MYLLRVSPKEPTITRAGALTRVQHLATTDQLTRAPHGRRCALATDDGVWVMDLDDARVVTLIPTARVVAGMFLPDDDTLVVLTRDGVLCRYALPDGGCTHARVFLGAWAILSHTSRRVVLAGAANLGDALDTLFHVIALPSFESTDIAAERFTEALRARAPEHERPTAANTTPWGALSPDGERFAFSFETRTDPPRPWFPGMLDEAGWSHVYSFQVDDPEGTLTRWAAPLEGWTLCWRDRDTLSGYVPVATGQPPYRTMPFARRRIRRDGVVDTWRPDDTDLLLAPRAFARATDLDDGGILAWISSVGAANATVWEPLRGVTHAVDLLADVAPDALHAEAPVLVDVWPDGGIARALPRRDGHTRITLDGSLCAEVPAGLGPPQFLDVHGDRATLRWTLPDAPWSTAWVSRGR